VGNQIRTLAGSTGLSDPVKHLDFNLNERLYSINITGQVIKVVHEF